MVYVNPSFTWDDFKKIRSWTKLPILIKGISSEEDVHTAVKYGAMGLGVLFFVNLYGLFTFWKQSKWLTR